VEAIVDELTEAAAVEIEKAAAEAAKAASIAALRAEAEKLNKAYTEAAQWKGAYNKERKTKWKTALIVGGLCLAGGFVGGLLITR
jgi:uncharacterized membrane protein